MNTFYSPPVSPERRTAQSPIPSSPRVPPPSSTSGTKMEIVAREVGEVVGFVLCGVAAWAIAPSVTSGLFTFSAVLLVGRLVLVSINSSFPNSQRYTVFKQSIHDQIAENQKLQTIAFIFSLAICMIFHDVGCAMLGILAVIHAIVIDVDRSKQKEISPEDKRKLEQSPLLNLFRSI